MVNIIGECGYEVVVIGGNFNISNLVIGCFGDGYIILVVVCRVVLEKIIGCSGKQIVIGIEN